MPTFDDVAAIASSLPDVSEGLRWQNRTWLVDGKGGQPGFFTIQHFDNYPAVLIQLERVRPKALREAITDAWLCCAPPAAIERYRAGKT